MSRTGMRDQHSIEMKDGSPSFIAGLWDGWQNPHTKERLRTCVIITCEPNEMVAQIHTRMPVILPPETHEQWLSAQAGKEILRPFPAQEMAARRISQRFNKLKRAQNLQLQTLRNELVYLLSRCVGHAAMSYVL
jgi:putative SOS response-associated peptidase YedK